MPDLTQPEDTDAHSEGESTDQIPESPLPTETFHIDTEGGTVIHGDVIVSGDFVGRDVAGQQRPEPETPPAPPAPGEGGCIVWYRKLPAALQIAVIAALIGLVGTIGAACIGVAPEIINLLRATPAMTATATPTLTPLPTVTFTVEAPVTPTPCALPVDSQLDTLWSRDRLGCPIEPAKSTPLAQEPFERGHMLWREDLRYIYVLYDDGTWQWFKDTWDIEQPEYTCPELAPSQTPPTPCRGFGKVWCQETEVRGKIGQAEDKEKGYTGIIQTFQHGLMITSAEDGIYILYDDDTWEGH